MTQQILTRQSLLLHTRWMVRRDMPEVLQIERADLTCPWTEEHFLRCLRQRNCIGMVDEDLGGYDGFGRVVGFMLYELHEHKLHILNFAVDPIDRRTGVGSHMVAKLIGKLSSHRRTRITLEVRETNLAAQLFFKHQGFRARKVLRGHYDDSGEDGYRMDCRLLGGE